MGAELCHFDIPADDLEALADFYWSTLGWKIEPYGESEEEPYLMITPSERDGAVMGGMMRRQVPEQTPMNYYQVDDLEAYNSRVKENGGQVVMERMPVRNMGYFSICVDSQGNAFGL